MLLAVMMLFMMVTVPIVANPMEEEEEEEEAKIEKCEWCTPGYVTFRCTGTQIGSYSKYCTKNYNSCNVTVLIFMHGGFCNACMTSASGPHDHIEYHTHNNCVPTQGICQFY